jgi:hypothetical protein
MFGKTKKLLRDALAALDTAVATSHEAIAASQECVTTANKALQLVDRLFAEAELLRVEKATAVTMFETAIAERDFLSAKLRGFDSAYLRNCGIVVETKPEE